MHAEPPNPITVSELTPVEPRPTDLQADRQGRASDFGAAYAKSEYKRAADKEIVAQLAMASDLGGCAGRLWVCPPCLRLP